MLFVVFIYLPKRGWKSHIFGRRESSVDDCEIQLNPFSTLERKIFDFEVPLEINEIGPLLFGLPFNAFWEQTNRNAWNILLDFECKKECKGARERGEGKGSLRREKKAVISRSLFRPLVWSCFDYQEEGIQSAVAKGPSCPYSTLSKHTSLSYSPTFFLFFLYPSLPSSIAPLLS